MIDPLALMVQSNRNRKLNSNPFLNRTFSFCGNNLVPYDNEDNDNYNIISLRNNNNFLMNYGNIVTTMMNEEKKSMNNLYNLKTKIIQLKNLKQENAKRYLDQVDYYKNKEKAEKEYYASELNNIYINKKNKILENKNKIKLEKAKKENLEQIKQKKLEQKAINKRMKQDMIINEIKNKLKIKLKKYQKDKILQKEKEEKNYIIKKNQFKIDTNLKINELKNKTELVPQLIKYFEKTNSKISKKNEVPSKKEKKAVEKNKIE